MVSKPKGSLEEPEIGGTVLRLEERTRNCSYREMPAWIWGSVHVHILFLFISIKQLGDMFSFCEKKGKEWIQSHLFSVFELVLVWKNLPLLVKSFTRPVWISLYINLLGSKQVWAMEFELWKLWNPIFFTHFFPFGFALSKQRLRKERCITNFGQGFKKYFFVLLFIV